jgi:hypothetical protein
MAPAVVYGWQGNLALLAEWYRTVTQTTSPNLLTSENISFAAVWARWLGIGPTAAALAAATVAISLAAAVIIWARRDRVARPGFLELGYLLLLIPMISPQGWDYVMIAATPAIVVLVDRFRERSTTWQIITAAGFLLTSFMIYDLLGRWLYLTLLGLSGITIGGVLLAASLVRLRLTAAA